MNCLVYETMAICVFGGRTVPVETQGAGAAPATNR
jgi:hypothetical protein